MIRLENVQNCYRYPLVRLCGLIINWHFNMGTYNEIKPRIYASPIKTLSQSLDDLTMVNCSSWPINAEDGHFKIFLHLTTVGDNWFKLWVEDKRSLTFIEIKLCYQPLKHCDHLVRLVYVLCRPEDDDFDDQKPNDVDGDTSILRLFDNGKFEAPEDSEDNSIESATKRIAIAALMAQCFFAETVTSGTQKTFNLEFNDNDCDNHKVGWPVVHRFTLENCTNRQLWTMKSDEIWKLVASQIMNRSDFVNELPKENFRFLAFCSFSRFRANPDAPAWLPSKQVQGYVSLGGGGLALLSTHCLYTWPDSVADIVTRFGDKRLVDQSRFMNDSNNRNCLWGCYATTLGATIHELAHTFHLGHSESGLMSRDFNHIEQFFSFSPQIPAIKWFTNSEITILRHNRWFQGDVSEQKSNNCPNSSIIYLNQNRTINSENGIVVAEYRQLDTNLVLFSQIWPIPIGWFQVPESVPVQIDSRCSDQQPQPQSFTNQFILFVMDTEGNVLIQNSSCL